MSFTILHQHMGPTITTDWGGDLGGKNMKLRPCKMVA